MVTYTNNKKLNKPANGEFPDTWDVPVNQDWDIIDKALGSAVSFTVGASDIILTISDAQNQRIVLTGTPGASRYIIIPFQYLSAVTAVGGMWIVDNQTNADQYVITEVSGSAGVTVSTGRKALVYSDGTDVKFADETRLIAGTGISVSGSTVSLSTPVSTTNGGTGISNPTAGSVLVGNGSSALSLVAPGANGNVLTSNGSTWTSAAPTSGGPAGITSITINTGTIGLTATPSTITSPGGTITISGTLAMSNGGTGVTTISSGLVRSTGSTLNGAATVNLATEITGTLGTSNGGTGLTSLGSGVSSALSSAVSGSGGGIVVASSPSMTSPTMTNPTISSGPLYYSGGAYIALSGGTFGVFSGSANILSGNTTETTFNGGIVVPGTPKANQTNFTLISDERTKKDIRPYLKSLSDVVTLDPVTFEYNGQYGTPNDNVTRVGLIAQQVNNTPMSELVGTYVYTDPTTGQQTTLYDLNISDLMFAFINAIKALDARVKDLEAKVGP